MGAPAFRALGKQVKRDDQHFANAASPEIAAQIAQTLNAHACPVACAGEIHRHGLLTDVEHVRIINRVRMSEIAHG